MARITRVTPGVAPGSSMQHFNSPALTPVPAIPSRMSPTNRSIIGSGMSMTSPGPVKWNCIGTSL